MHLCDVEPVLEMVYDATAALGITWQGSFPPRRFPQTLDRQRPVVAGAPPPHRVADQLARSARQKSRGGPTGGSGLGSAVLGSRDQVWIVARSKEREVLWGLRLNSNLRSHGDTIGS